jgi:hypothetical protein
MVRAGRAGNRGRFSFSIQVEETRLNPVSLFGQVRKHGVRWQGGGSRMAGHAACGIAELPNVSRRIPLVYSPAAK